MPDSLSARLGVRGLAACWETASAHTTNDPAEPNPMSASVASGVDGATTLSTSPGWSTVSVTAMKPAISAAATKLMVAQHVPY